MSNTHRQDEGPCLSAGTIMELLDGQLGRRERQAALLHLEQCPRCQHAAEGLTSVAAAVQVHLRCLDDEAIACYVDHISGRVRGGLDRAELRRIREHLKQCVRCREEVAITAAACRRGTGVLGWARGLIGRDGATRHPTHRPVVRWAGAVAIAGAAVILYLALGRSVPRQQFPKGMPVARGPTAAGVESGPSSSPAPSAVPEIKTPSPGPAPGGPGRPQRTQAPKAKGERLVRPRIPPQTETALVPPEEGAKGATARALAAVEQARKSGSAERQATAAFRLASLYHRQGQYRLAADSYREAGAAAEKANQPELRVDALILLGSALAELHDAAGARQQFDLALTLSRKAGYRKGEQNALVQLRLLESEAAAGDGKTEQSPPVVR